MKVIGLSGDSYIVEVSHDEIEKVTDKYYRNLSRLKVGDVLNLGEGYDFRKDIHSACKQMVDTISRFESVQKSLFNFAKVVGHIPDAQAEGKP